MANIDLSLKLCSGHPIYADDLPIYPVSISRITEIGYSKFISQMQIFCFSASDILRMTGREMQEIGVYRYYIQCGIADSTFMDMLVSMMSLFTRSSVYFSQNDGVFLSDSFSITEEKFYKMQSIIKIRNGLEDVEDEVDNPANDAARRILQRRTEEREKLRRVKKNEDGDDIDISDLVSIYANGVGLLIRDVMEYDLYQFNNQFNRLKIMSDYDVSVQALLHGAKKESVNLKHWITKIKRDSE